MHSKIVIFNTLAFFKKCRACEEGLDEVSELHFLKI